MSQATELPTEKQALPQRIPRTRAELDLTDLWARIYGDPGGWSDELADAFQNTLWVLLTGGAA